MPTSYFPTEFAQAILQLKQQRIQQQAELDEMRRSRQQQAEIEQSRIFWNRVAEQNRVEQAGEELEFRKQAFETEQVNLQKAAEQRIALEGRRLEENQEQLKFKALSDLATNGAAFIPTSGYSDYVKLRDSFQGADAGEAGTRFHEIPVPGQGIYVQRLDGEYAARVSKYDAETAKLQAEAAASQARANYYNNKNAIDLFKSQQSKGSLNARDAETISRLITDWQAEAHRKAAVLKAAGDPRAEEILRDWRAAYRDDPTATKIIEDNLALLAGYTQTLRENLPIPGTTNLQALRIAGLEESFLQTVSGQALPPMSIPGMVAPPPEVKVTGRVLETPHPSQRARQTAAATFILSSGKTVTLNDLERLNGILDDVAAGRRSRDDPLVQEAYTVLSAISTYEQQNPSWVSLTNE